MLSRHNLTAIVMAAAVALPAAAFARCIQPAGIDDLRAQIVAGVNAERAAQGLQALQPDASLDQAAQSLACDNAERQTVSHVSSNGGDLRKRLRNVGYRFSAASENVGRGQGSPQAMVTWWMGSPGHRDNILTRNSRDIGVGIAVSDAPDSRLHWVINLGASR